MTVAIMKVGARPAEAVSSAMEAADFRAFIPRGSKVLLKVNLGWDLWIPGSVTNPAVFEAVVKTLKGHAGSLAVIESDQVLENIEKAYRTSMISRIAAEHGVSWINLSRCRTVKRRLESNKVIKEVTLPEVLTEGVVVTLPVLKTHDKTTVSISLKNQWGCIPKMRHMYHLCLDEAIADVNAAVGVKFAVADGTVAMEGNAPKTGIPRELGIVGAGGDLVEVDSVCAKLMGFDPLLIPHLLEAQRRGLGSIGTSFVGDVPDPIEPFLPARHNLVSAVELRLRTSPLGGLVFKTPFFLLMLAGAKIYYYVFHLLRGRSLRRRFRQHPLYGRYFARP